jgi:hypothetical protein
MPSESNVFEIESADAIRWKALALARFVVPKGVSPWQALQNYFAEPPRYLCLSNKNLSIAIVNHMHFDVNEIREWRIGDRVVGVPAI